MNPASFQPMFQMFNMFALPATAMNQGMPAPAVASN
jgi:hypothetical protein